MGGVGGTPSLRVAARCDGSDDGDLGGRNAHIVRLA